MGRDHLGLQYLPDTRVGAVAWRGPGRLGGSALQAVMPRNGMKPSRAEGDGWGQVFLQCPRVQPPQLTSVAWPSRPRVVS